jgi:fucose 4-O-acetylase-like acetyltransferase
MRLNRRHTIPVLVLLVLLGVTLAFDQRFVSLSELTHKPAMVVYIYAPTAFFAVLGVIQFRRGRFWPAMAFAAGLIVTGLFHQSVIDASHGNPGYMFPAGHMIAPLVSFAAYSISLLGAWGVARVLQRKREMSSPE